MNQRAALNVIFAPSLVALACLIALASLLVGCGSRAQTNPEQLYTCGMHPQVIQSTPGNCPICGMKLTPIRKQPSTSAVSAKGPNPDGERKVAYYKSTMNPAETSPNPGKDSMGMDMVPVYAVSNGSSAISIDPTTIQNMDIRVGLVRRGSLRRLIRTVGIIDFDETALAEVSTKFRGWVEKLYVDSTGKQMHRGEPLFEIYSPELYLAQTEYLLTLSSVTNQDSVASQLRKTAAMTKLRYWDISEDQIAELERTRTPKKTLRMNAPHDGIVVEKMVVEGQMVEPGMKLYRLADLASVWIQAQVYEQDLPFIKLGQEAVVTLASLPDPKFRGRVTYIYPVVDEKTRTAKVRMEFHNPGYFLKPGMYATVEIAAEISPSALLVPDMAVLRSGEKNTVFVALDNGHFEPRPVAIGARGEGNFYEVVSGLKDGDRVVTSGQFMLDSESQLREAIQKMSQPSAAEPSGESGAQSMTSIVSAEATNSLHASQEIVYICPMPEHVSLEYNHVGSCPLCGMTLVPVSREMLSRIQPGGKIEYYTCPMPEHSDVHQDKPGKCPKCGMTLIPVMVRPGPIASAGVSMPMGGQLPEKLYTCPMAEHADVVSDKPGVCPKCAMELVETTKVNHGPQAEENWRRKHVVKP